MTRWDRIITAVTISWPILFTLVFIAGMLRELLAESLGLEPISDAAWLEAWGWWQLAALAANDHIRKSQQRQHKQQQF